MSTEKGRIRASTESGGSGRIPEIWDPGEYQEGRNLGEFQKGGNPGECQENRNLGEYQRRVQASTGKGGI